MTKHILSFVSAALVSGAALAQDATPPTAPPATAAAADTQALVTLTNGDLIRGALVSDGDPVVINHPVLGQVSFPRASVAGVKTMSATDAGKATAAAAEAAGKFPPPPPPPDPDTWFKGWTGLVEAGVNGSSGNTETFAGRFGVGAARETSKTKSTIGFSYNYGVDDGQKSKDNARLDIRNDWLPQGGSKWRPFAQGTLEYDTFQDWDYRYSAFVGVGYELIKNDKILLLPRAGIGLSQEIGGSDTKIHPEGLLGLDFEWKVNDRSKFFVSGDTYWQLDELPDYRAFVRAGYEVLVDDKSKLTLKLGIEDRYDSSPGEGRNRNDLTYFALLALPF